MSWAQTAAHGFHGPRPKDSLGSGSHISCTFSVRHVSQSTPMLFQHESKPCINHHKPLFFCDTPTSSTSVMSKFYLCCPATFPALPTLILSHFAAGAGVSWDQQIWSKLMRVSWPLPPEYWIQWFNDYSDGMFTLSMGRVPSQPMIQDVNIKTMKPQSLVRRVPYQ